MGEVKAIFGGEVIANREPSRAAIEVLEDMLERARAGDVQAVALVAQYYDGCAGYVIGGRLGGYSIIGAAVKMTQSLADTA